MIAPFSNVPPIVAQSVDEVKQPIEHFFFIEDGREVVEEVLK